MSAEVPRPEGAAARLRRFASSREGVALALVLLVGLVLRALYLRELVGAPDFASPAIDAGFHDFWARRILDASHPPPPGLGDPGIGEHAYLRPPGYPWWLAGVYSLSGGSYLAARAAQMVAGLVGVGLALTLGRRAGGPVGGAVAGALVAAHWAPIYFEGELQAEGLLLPVALGALLALARWSSRPGWRAALAAGLLLGGGSLLRPNLLAFVPAALLWMPWSARGRASARARWSGVAATALGCALAIAPATLRNWLVAGELVPITTGAGINLYLGNNPEADGEVASEVAGLGEFRTCFDYPGLVAALEERTGRELGDAEVSAWFRDEALRYLRANPGRALELLAHKAALFWGPAEVTHNKVVALERGRSGVLSRLPAPFPPVVAGALAGLVVLSWRARRGARPSEQEGDGEGRRLAWLMALFVLTWFLSVWPFFAASRYRAPIVPALLVLAGAGCGAWARSLSQGAWRPVVASVLTLVVAWPCFAAIHSPQSADVFKWRMDRGRALARQGRHEEALDELERALEVRPGSAEARFSLGLSAGALGREREASEHYRAAIALDPDAGRARHNLAVQSARRGEQARRAGRLEEAAQAFQEALAVEPGLLEARRALARTLVEAGDWEAARAALERCVREAPGSQVAQLELARLLAGSPVSSVRDGRRAVELAQACLAGSAEESPEVLAILAAARAEAGDLDGAVRACRAALEAVGPASGPGLRERLEAQLELHRSGRPWRLPVAGGPR